MTGNIEHCIVGLFKARDMDKTRQSMILLSFYHLKSIDIIREHQGCTGTTNKDCICKMVLSNRPLEKKYYYLIKRHLLYTANRSYMNDCQNIFFLASEVAPIVARLFYSWKTTEIPNS